MRKLFGPIIRLSFYESLLYSIISFPLGIIYFTILSILISLGLCLLILWIGIPILNFALFLGNKICKLEKLLYVRLIDSEMNSDRLQETEFRLGGVNSLMQNFKNQNWISSIKSLAKLPLGIIYLFVNFSTLLMSLAFIATLIVYGLRDVRIVPNSVKIFQIYGTELVQNYLTAGFFSVIGIALLGLSLRLIRTMSYSTGRMY